MEVLTSVQDLKRNLNVMKKFNTNVICDLSAYTLKLLAVHPKYGYVRTVQLCLPEDFDETSIIRTTFHVVPLLNYISKAIGDITISFDPENNICFTRPGEMPLNLKTVDVTTDFKYSAFPLPICTIIDNSYVFHKMYKKLPENENIKIAFNADTNTMTFGDQTIETESYRRVIFEADISKEQLDFFQD